MNSKQARYHPWLHRWAVLTAVAVIPLLLSGGTVTSMRVGMADPSWPSPPWYLLAIDWAETTAMNGIGFMVEHGHRAIGWAVGLFTIVLAAWLWLGDGRRWVAWLGIVALVGVGIQGVLGGARVLLHVPAGPELAMAHGVFGQLVFTLVASIAVVTSSSWIHGSSDETPDASKFRRLTRLTALLVLTQLLLGVWLRQSGSGDGSWVLLTHLLLALAVLAHAVMLVVRVRRGQINRQGYLGWPTHLLLALVVIQVGLGGAAWWFGAGQGATDWAPVTVDRAFFATAHVLTGALVLMTATLTTLRAFRHLTPEPVTAPATAPSSRLSPEVVS